MSLAETSKAIGAVTDTLKLRISDLSNIPDINVGSPEVSDALNVHLNLFLYEIDFDPHLKNTSLNEGEKPPVWMVLKYMLTAFSAKGVSDTVAAHEALGAAIRAINTNDLLNSALFTPTNTKALAPNPSKLHVTFDESPADLLAKLMQGSDEKYRLSICFEVRPVMIAPAEPGDYSLLVGVDYTSPPNLADPYVGIEVIPSMGSVLERIFAIRKDINGNEIETGAGFEVGEDVIITGTDLHLTGLSVMLGAVELPVTMQQPDRLKFKIDPAIIAASGISAGSYPVTVVQTLPATGKKRKSNMVIGNLVPTISTAVPATPPPLPPVANTVTIIAAVPPIPKQAFARIDLTGVLLGTDKDDVILAFYRNGSVVKMVDVFAFPAAPAQTKLQLAMVATDALSAGDYNMILIVNGQQAPQSPLVHLDIP